MPDATVLRVPPGARMVTPLCRLAQEIAALTGWRRYGLGFLFGVVLAATMPPVDLTPLLLVAFPGLLWLDEGSASAAASFRLGYVFGLGFFIGGLYWIAAALFVDIAAFWWLVPFAVVGLPALLALFPAAALWATAFAAGRLGLAGAARVCLFAIAWSGAEWLRGHLFTGLPWNLTGYAWSGAFPGALAVLQSAAWFGIYGLTYVTTLAASLPMLLGIPSLAPRSAVRRWAPGAAAAFLILLPAAAGAVHLEAPMGAATGIWLRLVQPSIPESLKWDPRRAATNLHRLIVLSEAPSTHPLAAVIWPEAAVPFFVGRSPAVRAALAAAAPKSGYLITGTLRATPPAGAPQHIYNSIEALDREGDILARYDKAHLVPFGEYVPFRNWLPFLKKITPGTIDLSAGPGPRTLDLPGLPPFAALICYEAIFPGAIIGPGKRPDWLLNVTNDAWYGRTSGPYQHFDIARTRAVEEGLPLVRVGNNGISGVVDADGRVLSRVNLNDVGYADVMLPPPGRPTLYSRAGDSIFALMLLLGFVPVAMRRR